MEQTRKRGKFRKCLIAFAVLAALVVIANLLLYCYSLSTRVPPDQNHIQKLLAAKHLNADPPASKSIGWIYQKLGAGPAVLVALGIEPRDVTSITNGSPQATFVLLSFFTGMGEIIWVDDWTNFPVKLPALDLPSKIAIKYLQPSLKIKSLKVTGLPPSTITRREAIKVALDAIKASGGCLIKAGDHRYLVAKISEQKQYEAAIRAVGWLNGVEPAWVQESLTNRPSTINASNAK